MLYYGHSLAWWLITRVRFSPGEHSGAVSRTLKFYELWVNPLTNTAKSCIMKSTESDTENRERKMVSQHARENAEKYLRPAFTNKRDATRFQAECAAAMNKNGSTAVVLALDNPVSNPHRDDWAPNDHLVGIVRNRNLVTVMLSRAAQITKKHLRTDRVAYA